MTSNKEDYLKIIYMYLQDNIKITNKLLSQHLEVSAPSVTEMLNKLMVEGWLVKDKNLGFILTPKGEDYAKVLVSKHRIWEYFLVNYLDMKWESVHDDAEILEHATSDTVLNHLNKFMDYPKYCPHGDAIYINHDKGKKVMALSDVTINKEVKIQKVEDNVDLLEYMNMKGLSLGSIVKVINHIKYDNSLELLMDNNHITISKQAAQEIFVKEGV